MKNVRRDVSYNFSFDHFGRKQQKFGRKNRSLMFTTQKSRDDDEKRFF